MKKVSIFTVAMLACGVTFAQHTATTTQSGDHNSSAVTQGGAAGNTATVLQQSNAANASQGNVANIDQTSSDASSTATIMQGNVPSPAVKKTEAYITQTGFGNNDATIEQNTSGQNGNRSQSYIDQAGQDNFAKTTMLGHQGQNEITRIDQTGYDNYATQLKDDEREGQLLITQTNYTDDEGNYATQETGKDQARLLEIIQDGDGNRAEQYSRKGSWNRTYQTGDYNEAYTDQDAGFDHNSTVTQDGDYNYADVDQNADNGKNGHDLTLDQIGNGNRSIVTQDGENNIGDIDVVGNNNLTVDLMQDGIGNDATMDITGNNNSMTVSQTGDGHIATETMVGNGNTASVVQSN